MPAYRLKFLMYTSPFLDVKDDAYSENVPLHGPGYKILFQMFFCSIQETVLKDLSKFNSSVLMAAHKDLDCFFTLRETIVEGWEVCDLSGGLMRV